MSAASASSCYLFLMYTLSDILLLLSFFIMIDLLSSGSSLLLILSCQWMLNMAHKRLMALFRKAESCLFVARQLPRERLWDGDYVQGIEWGVPLGTTLKWKEGSRMVREVGLWCMRKFRPLSNVPNWGKRSPFHWPTLALGEGVDCRPSS